VRGRRRRIIAIEVCERIKTALPTVAHRMRACYYGYSSRSFSCEKRKHLTGKSIIYTSTKRRQTSKLGYARMRAIRIMRITFHALQYENSNLYSIIIIKTIFAVFAYRIVRDRYQRGVVKVRVLSGTGQP